MSIAYIISAYKRPEQLIRLVARLSSPAASFFIHVDRRTDETSYRRMLEGTQGFRGVTFLQRHACHWGDFGHVRASLKGIRAIEKQDVACDYVVLLTAQDYPLKSSQQIEAFFRHAEHEYIVHYPLPCEHWEGGGLGRTAAWHVWIGGRRIVLPKRLRLRGPAARGGEPRWSVSLELGPTAPAGFRLFGGSSYWCLSRACVAYIARFVNDHPGFVRFFRSADISDELFFQTIVMNSPFRERAVNDGLRYIDWKFPDAGGPGILGQADLPSLLASPKLFARKFDIMFDPVILDLLDAAIAGGASSVMPPKSQAGGSLEAPL